MHSLKIRNRAIELRKSGRGIKDIAREFDLNPTTVSYWCKNIELSQALLEKIVQQSKRRASRGMLVYTEKLRKARLERIKMDKWQGAKSLGKISKRDFYMVGLGLYWGDGYKVNSEFGFTNSNLDLIKFYLIWLELQGVNKKDLIFKLTINKAFKRQERRLKRSWSDVLKVDPKQFTATTVIKTTLKKAVTVRGNSYRGVLRVKVRRGARRKSRILGAIERLTLVQAPSA